MISIHLANVFKQFVSKILQKLHTKQEGESIRTTTKSPNLRFLLVAGTYALHIVQFHVLDLVQRVLRSGCRQIRQLVQALLSLAHIPVQSVGQGCEPVGYLILGADAWHGINGGGHAKAVAMEELLPVASIEANPRCVAALGGY